MDKHLHIICFTVPFPVDYGGVVDLFWKLPILQKNGVKIHLHCFDYGRGKQEILNQYCIEVNYYNRSKGLLNLFSSTPYIVSSRKNKVLEDRLLQDDYPILCEGLHSSAILSNVKLNSRKIIVRLHNVEHEYYHHLQKSTTHIFKKLFFWRESQLLKKYETYLAQTKHQLLTLSELDAEKFKQQFYAKNIDYLPLFIPDDWNLNSRVGKENYCLYHGDLSVVANQKSVIWLIENVIKNLVNIHFVVAGKNPSKEIQDKIQTISNLKLIANPSDVELNNLIAKAHINILPSNSSSGIKLKLLNALYNGGFCISNNETLAGSGLNELCFIANSAEEFHQAILKLMDLNFEEKEREKRKLVLTKNFNNQKTAELLIQYIFG